MNIGEQFFCSRCLRELEDEMLCPACGYDPSEPTVSDVLEEGVLLNCGQYQIGAVMADMEDGLLYGAYDHDAKTPVFIFEYFPRRIRSKSRDALKSCGEFETWHDAGRTVIEEAFSQSTRLFEENNMVYAVIPLQKVKIP